MRRRLTWSARGALAAIAMAASHLALAAGGHHAVDDAGLLEPGQCKLEGWFSRAGDGTRGLHTGVGCRVGPLELGVANEYTRADGASATAWGLAAKWATPLADGLSVGLSVAPAWEARARPRYQGTTVTGLLTWAAAEQVALHANLGRDVLRDASDDNRWGVAAEWTPAPGWTLLAERYRASGTHFVRAGARWAGGENWSLDFSRAQRLRGTEPSTWTLGATWVFERR